MNSITQQQRKSKIYLPNVQSIALNKDLEHLLVTDKEYVEPKDILEKKNIDKIMHNVVKERMFGNFFNEDNKVSMENYYNIELINKQHQFRPAKSRNSLDNSRSSKPYSIELTLHKKRSCSKNHQYFTIDNSRTSYYHPVDQIKAQAMKRRSFTRKLPTIVGNIVENSNPMRKKIQKKHQKKLDINEKITGDKFRKWAGVSSVNNITIYDIKLTREIVMNQYRNIVDVSIIERFYHFFGFPQSFGLRGYCNLMENAVNCNMKFIYFWVFALFDQNKNGILQSQDLFRFLQRFKTENYYIEEEVYKIERYLMKIQKEFKPKQQKQLVEQMLVVNHNLKLDQLQDLMKESQKERINVNCVKNTCYHQTVYSIEHDPIEREKQSKIEANQLQTKRLKQEMMEVKKKLQNTPGLRLRDFYAIFGGDKRPRIFCYFISLLTGQSGSYYE